MAKYSRRRKTTRRRRSKPARKRRSLLRGGKDDTMIKNAREIYGRILLDEELQEAFFGVCRALNIEVKSISEGDEKKDRILTDDDIGKFVDKLENQDVFKKFTELANKNPEVKRLVTVIQHTLSEKSGGGQIGGEDVPSIVEDEANTLFVLGLVCFIGGVVGCATTHLSFSAGSVAIIGGGSAMLVSFGLRDVYRATRSLYRAVISRTGRNDGDDDLTENLTQQDDN